MILLQISIVLTYGVLSSLEYLSFYSRLAGKIAGTPVTGYAQQNIILMISRFASVLMMPALGYLVDKQISTTSYLHMVLASLLLAALLSVVANKFKKKLLARMVSLLSKDSKPILTALLHRRFKNQKLSILAPTTLVYFSYGMAFFISYFAALRFPELRTTLSNSAAAINGIATIVLSIYIEPKVSRIIDSHGIDETSEIIETLLNGRLIAIGLAGPLLTIYAIWWFS